ncbi:MAG TPA: hypothetical protein VH020_08625, partial [Stellaceae bacterium]|nr:hypothetical protein [Stellaceae bacterium]
PTTYEPWARMADSRDSPSTPAEFRKHAAECERLAELAIEPARRAVFLAIAAKWYQLANEEEASSRFRESSASPRSPTPE